MQPNLLAAVRQIAAERGLDVNEVIETIKQAVRVAYKHIYPDEMGNSLEIELNDETGRLEVYADKKVVEEVTNPPTQISLSDAKKIEPRLKVGDHVLVEITDSGDFGRIAAQASRQVLSQKLRESEKDAIMTEIADKIGSVDTAIVQRVDREGNVFVELHRAIAKMPPEEQIRTEFYKSAMRIKVFLKKIHTDAKGKILIVSRADPKFLEALFEIEVPEINSGTVEIMGTAREAGLRAKVAVRSNSSGVDPIGACVGQRGARINAITNELKLGRTEEKIDIIPWDQDIATFIANSIRPAEAIEVKIISESEKQALILVNDDTLSLAIGRDGINAKLAAKLTGWWLDIQGVNAYKEAGEKSSFEGGAKAAPKKEETPAEKVSKASSEELPVVEVELEEKPAKTKKASSKKKETTDKKEKEAKPKKAVAKKTTKKAKA